MAEGKDLMQLAYSRLLDILEDESVSVIYYSLTEFARDQSRSRTVGAFPVLNKNKSQRILL